MLRKTVRAQAKVEEVIEIRVSIALSNIVAAG